MSMFHELMMRKKEETMYATIKGTLTENDGVFSGFSDSNYLALQNSFKLNANTVAEFKFKVNLTSVSVVSGILSTPNNYGMQFVCGNDSKLTLYLGDNSSWTILSAKKGTTTIQANTDYYIRLLIDKGTITLLLSTDDITYTTEFTAVVTIPEEYTYNLGYGRGRTTTQYLRGSIDLPNSYIKLGSTKYKLQAVVGYTIVGSPTIVDGVVSGFSSSDYLQLGAVPNINQDFEIQCKFTTGNTIENGGIISSNNYFMNGFRIINSKVAFSVYFNGAVKNCIIDTNITTNTTYIAYAKRTGNNISVILYDENKVILSTNNLSVDDYTISLPAYTYLGYGVRSGIFNGSIDLNNNNTYIKLGNKLWFNGQEG